MPHWSRGGRGHAGAAMASRASVGRIQPAEARFGSDVIDATALWTVGVIAAQAGRRLTAGALLANSVLQGIRVSYNQLPG